MKTKCLFGGLIAMLLFFVVNQQRFSVPNQEIKFHFSEFVSSQDVNKTIQEVELQLLDLGATNVLMSKDENGNLTLNYNSDQGVLKIQSLIYKLSDISNNSNIKLDIYEINKPTRPISGFDHKKIIEHKSEFDRSANPNVYTALQPIKYKDLAVAIKNTVALKQNIVFCLSNTLHNIPEVRAGPRV